MAMNVLPFALLGGGTVAAIVSLVYGLALRRFAAKFVNGSSDLEAAS
jgi:hypothetical protein